MTYDKLTRFRDWAAKQADARPMDLRHLEDAWEWLLSRLSSLDTHDNRMASLHMERLMREVARLRCENETLRNTRAE